MKKLPHTNQDNHETTSTPDVPNNHNFSDLPPSTERESIQEIDSLKGDSAPSQLVSERVSKFAEPSRCGEEYPEIISGREVRSSRENCDLESAVSYYDSTHFNIDRKLPQGKEITRTDSTVSFGNELNLPEPTSFTVPCNFSHDDFSISDELIHSDVPPGVQLGARTSVHELLRQANAYSNLSQISSPIRVTTLSKGELKYFMELSGAPSFKSQTLVNVQERNPSKQPSPQEEGSHAPSSSSSPRIRRPVNRRKQRQDTPTRKASSSSVSSLSSPRVSGKKLLKAVASVHQIRGSQQRPRPLRSRSPQTQDQLQDVTRANDTQLQPQARAQHRREEKKHQNEHRTQPQRQHESQLQMIPDRPPQLEHKRQLRNEDSTTPTTMRQQRRLSENMRKELLMMQDEYHDRTENKPDIKEHPRHQSQLSNQGEHETHIEPHKRPQKKSRSESQSHLTSKTQLASQETKPARQPKKHHSKRQGEMQVKSRNQARSKDWIESRSQLAPQTIKRDNEGKNHQIQRPGEVQVEPLDQPQRKVQLESQSQVPRETQVALEKLKRDNERKKRRSSNDLEVEPFNQPQSEVQLESRSQFPRGSQLALQKLKRDNQRKERRTQRPGDLQIESLDQPRSEVQSESQSQIPRETQVAPRKVKRDNERKKRHSPRPGDLQVEPLNQPQSEGQLEPQSHIPSETQADSQTRPQSELPAESHNQLRNLSEDSLIRRPQLSVSRQFDTLVPEIRNGGLTVSRRSSTHSLAPLSNVSPPTSVTRFNILYSSRDLSFGSDDRVPAHDLHNDHADPWQYDNFLAKWEAWVHVIKGILGAGMLFLPFCFAHAGILVGVGIVLGSSAICYGSHYVIIRRSHELHFQEREECVGYAGVVKCAFMRGPWKFRQIASCFECFISVLVVIHGLTLGYIYVVIVSSIIGDIIQKYWMDLSFSQYTLFSLGLILPLNVIPTMKYLSSFVLIGNILLLSGIIILLYYLIENPTPNSLASKMAGNIQGMTVLFCCALFATQAVPLIVSVQTCMMNNASLINQFQVLEVVTVLVTALFISLGILGFRKFGGEVKAIIIFNLPQDSLAYYCKATFALSLCFSHPLIIYPVFEFFWEMYFKKAFIPLNIRNVCMGSIILRLTLTLLTIVPAFFIISLAKYCVIFVTMISTALIIILPAVIDICIRWNNRREESWTIRVILFVEVLLVVLGLYIFVFGTFWSIDVIRKLQGNDCT